MKTAKIFTIAGTLIMFFTLVYGFIYGDFFKEGGVIISIAWGKVSLIDVYIGFFCSAVGYYFVNKKNILLFFG